MPNSPKDGDGKRRVLASFEKPRQTPRRTLRSPGCCHDWTRSMKVFARFLYFLSLTAFCAACGGGGAASPSPPPPPPVASASPGGIWEGVDTVGVDVIALVTETGRFHFINEFFDSGSGILSVSNGNDVSGNFQLVTEIGSQFADGATLSNCALSGTVAERQTITVTVNCTTTAGSQSQSTITLHYNAQYERVSSLSVIEGHYDDSGLVINIDANGVIFEQDPVSGCVNNGQVSIIDTAYNAYDIQFGFSNCTGQFAMLNGTSFVGITTLDNTVTPEVLIVGATGDIAGVLVSFVGFSQRL